MSLFSRIGAALRSALTPSTAARSGPTTGRRSGTTSAESSPGQAGPSATIEIDPQRIGSVRMTYSPSRDGAPDPGEIVWTWVPFEERDGRGKDRPVLVVAAEKGGTYLGVQLTSKAHQGNAEFVPIGSGEWDSAGRPSWVNIDRVFRLHPAGCGGRPRGCPCGPSRWCPPGCASGTAGADPSSAYSSTRCRRPCPALCTRAGVQADGRGRGEVERFRATVDRHPHRLVCQHQQILGQAVRLRPEQPGGREVEDAVGGCRIEIELGAAAGGKDRQPCARQLVQQCGRVRGPGYRQVEEAARGRPDRLRVERVDGVAGDDDAVGSRRVGEPDDGPGVAGIVGLDQHGDQLRRAGQYVAHGRPADGCSGRRCPAGDRVGQRRSGASR